MDLCFPNMDDLTEMEKENWNIVMEQLKMNPLYMQIVNLYTAYRAILFSMASAFLLCILYIYFMSFFAEYLAWAMIFLT